MDLGNPVQKVQYQLIIELKMLLILLIYSFIIGRKKEDGSMILGEKSRET